jgi:hypothetical protein
MPATRKEVHDDITRADYLTPETSDLGRCLVREPVRVRRLGGMVLTPPQSLILQRVGLR